MKFKKIDGVQYIILEEDDRVCITTPDELDKSQVEIKEKDKKLDISGNSSIVSSIQGDGMLEKVYIPPVVSAKKIIEKCDNWFDMFKKVHDTFKKIVVTGHSLGGALATLAALELQQNDKTTPVKLITFCSPRVLSFEAYDYIIKNNILQQTGENSAIRIYRYGDVVPSMPLGSMGFKHFGEVFCITNAPKGFETDSGKTVYSKIKSYFSIKDWTQWAKSFLGYHSIVGVLEDVSNLGKDKKVTMYKELF